MAEDTLLVCVIAVIAGRRPNLAFQIVAYKAVAFAFKPMRNLGRQTGDERDRLDPACRRMADVAVARQMPLRSLVAVAAHVLGRLLALDMAAGTSRPFVRANQGQRMLRQTRFLKAGRRMALLAIGPIVYLARRLVASER